MSMNNRVITKEVGANVIEDLPNRYECSSFENYNCSDTKCKLKLEEAKEYAITSIKLQALPEALALLGEIYEALGESGNALQAYKGSVGLTYSKTNEVVSGEVLLSNTTVGLPSSSDDTEN